MCGTCPSNQQKSRLTSNPGCVDLATNSRGPFRVTAEFLPVVVTAHQFLRFHLQTCVTIVTVVDVVADVVASSPNPSQTSRGLSQGSRVARATECGVFRDAASGTARHCGGLGEGWKTTNTLCPCSLTQNEAQSASAESTVQAERQTLQIPATTSPAGSMWSGYWLTSLPMGSSVWIWLGVENQLDI